MRPLGPRVTLTALATWLIPETSFLRESSLKETVLAWRAVEVCTPLDLVVVVKAEVWVRRAAVRAKLWNFMVAKIILFIYDVMLYCCCAFLRIATLRSITIEYQIDKDGDRSMQNTNPFNFLIAWLD